MVAGLRITTGKLYTPDGTPYKGLKVTVGGVQDPETIKRSYEDIERIFKSNQTKFKTYEEKTPTGTFKTYIVNTN